MASNNQVTLTFAGDESKLTQSFACQPHAKGRRARASR